MGFNGDLTIKKVDATKYEIVGSIAYENHEVVVTVSEGFLTDGASIPHYLWGIVGSPFDGKYTEGAVIHDGLYGSHLTTKEFADKLFLEMMRTSGVSWWRRNAMYYAVKYFGSGSWNEKTDKKITKVREYVEVTNKSSIS